MKLSTKKRADYILGGLLLAVLKPLVILLGQLFRRDHDPQLRGHLAVMKMVGGGSLVIALPALLGLRRRFPDYRFTLVTTPSVAAFGRVLGVFDEVVVIDDRRLPALIASAAKALVRLRGVDTVIDFEAYSRLTTVLSLLTRARNRVGFYLESSFWRRGVCTHLIFFNRFSGTYHFYEAVGSLVGGSTATLEECGAYLRANSRGMDDPSKLPAEASAARAGGRMALGFACSEMGRERMLRPDQWEAFLQPRLKGVTDVHLMGSAADRAGAAELCARLASAFPAVTWHNDCDGRTLNDSLSTMSRCSLFVGIDSALLHFARHLGLPTVSVWGPTDPSTRLKSFDPTRETAVYVKIPCSPCIHVAEEPPCRGYNICITSAIAAAAGLPAPGERETLLPLYGLVSELPRRPV
ncbi:MAG: glycosyltransferase family 9 protein [Gemmatimonadaceae bacterium]|nr:glycosyltransferase family 9 protein [Gemmatimonadaceae bacterium]